MYLGTPPSAGRYNLFHLAELDQFKSQFSIHVIARWTAVLDSPYRSERINHIPVFWSSKARTLSRALSRTRGTMIRRWIHIAKPYTLTVADLAWIQNKEIGVRPYARPLHARPASHPTAAPRPPKCRIWLSCPTCVSAAILRCPPYMEVMQALPSILARGKSTSR